MRTPEDQLMALDEDNVLAALLKAEMCLQATVADAAGAAQHFRDAADGLRRWASRCDTTAQELDDFLREQDQENHP